MDRSVCHSERSEESGGRIGLRRFFAALRTTNASALPPMASDRPVSWVILLLTALLLTIFYALLWSPWWYPLSDSSLYLNMARGLMQGKGLASLRQIHRDVRQFTPLLLFAIM